MNTRSNSAAPAADSDQLHDQFNEVWGNPRGWRALTIVNHTTIGLRFMVTGGFFFLVGGLLAMLIRTQLALPGYQLMEPDVYNQVFTMHGTVIMFLFAVPMMEGLAVYLIPKMLGARDLVFPRLSALGYFCYLFGGLILLSSIFSTSRPRLAGSCTRRCPVPPHAGGEFGFLAARYHLRRDFRGIGRR
ncbi:Cytochrome c oxidase subunit I OS=Stutzerimonas stutzeri OX=316 GN=ctaD PE=3 SV=1 [Stutzerimonas stutzeri]